MGTAKYSGTCSKKGRGMAERSLDLIEAMYAVAKSAQPITGRGVGYKLFAAGLIGVVSATDASFARVTAAVSITAGHRCLHGSALARVHYTRLNRRDG
jgi:hypothetical protein